MRGVGRHVFGLEGLEELAEEQRIALRRDVARLGEWAFHGVAQPLANDLRSGVGAERPRSEHLRRRVASQLDEQPFVRSGLRTPKTAHDEDGEPLEPTDEVGEEP